MPRYETTPIPPQYRFFVHWDIDDLFKFDCRTCGRTSPHAKEKRPYLAACSSVEHIGDKECVICLANQVVYHKGPGRFSCLGCVRKKVPPDACPLPLDALVWCCPGNTALAEAVAQHRAAACGPPVQGPPPAPEDPPPKIDAGLHEHAALVLTVGVPQPPPGDPPEVIDLTDEPECHDDVCNKLIANTAVDDEFEWLSSKRLRFIQEEGDAPPDDMQPLCDADDSSIYEFLSAWMKSDVDVPSTMQESDMREFIAAWS